MKVAKKCGIEIEVIPEDAEGEIDFCALEQMLTSGRKPMLVAINHVPTNSGLDCPPLPPPNPLLPLLPSSMAGQGSESSCPFSFYFPLHGWDVPAQPVRLANFSRIALVLLLTCVDSEGVGIT